VRARPRPQIRADEIVTGERLQALAGGLTLHQIASGIVDALDPDRREEAGDGAPELLRQALLPLADNPELRAEIIEVRRSLEQTIDEVSIDEVLEAGYSAEARARAAAVTGDFRAFIEKHRDEIRALQLLYSRPYRERPTFGEIKELAGVLSRPPRSWTPEKLWQAYDVLDHSRVRGSGQRTLTDIVSLVRYALEQESELVPFEEGVRQRFDAWIAMQEQGRTVFTAEQRRWLEWMRDAVATDLGLSPESFEYAPFSAHGGLARAAEVFGDRLHLLMDELAGALAA